MPPHCIAVVQVAPLLEQVFVVPHWATVVAVVQLTAALFEHFPHSAFELHEPMPLQVPPPHLVSTSDAMQPVAPLFEQVPHWAAEVHP